MRAPQVGAPPLQCGVRVRGLGVPRGGRKAQAFCAQAQAGSRMSQERAPVQEWE